MTIFLEILKFTLPSVIVLIAVYFLIDRFLKNEDSRRNYKIRKQTANTVTPIRLRAYERLVIFLERTMPDSLILRIQQPGMSMVQLQTALLQTVREEYEHNVSQQLYVSKDAWIMLNNAKESLVQLINACAASLEEDTSAAVYAQVIIQTFHSTPESPTKLALDFLRIEIKNFF